MHNTTPASPKDMKVWDLAVRLFHWSLVGSFLIAYITEDDFMSLHLFAGYSITGLIVFRLLWGVIGPTHARFRNFIQSPTETLQYMQEVMTFRAKRYIGHNPAGGAMVIALLASLLITVVTGFAAYGAEQSAGPLAGMMSQLPYAIGKAAEEIHEFFANFTLLLVFLHVGGVLLASFQHRENLVGAMFSGRKRATD